MQQLDQKNYLSRSLLGLYSRIVLMYIDLEALYAVAATKVGLDASSCTPCCCLLLDKRRSCESKTVPLTILSCTGRPYHLCCQSGFSRAWMWTFYPLPLLEISEMFMQYVSLMIYYYLNFSIVIGRKAVTCSTDFW